MTIAGAIFLIAVGAILRFATNFHVKGVDMDTIGLILMIAGAVGLVLSFIYEGIYARNRRTTAYVDPADPRYQQQPPADPNYQQPPPPPADPRYR
jgi:hypothetical protein